jgi:cytochrome P450
VSTPLDMPTERDQPLDPPPEIGRLRRSSPLCRLRYPDGEVGWLATSYDLVRAIHSDARFVVADKFPVGDPEQIAGVMHGLRETGIARAHLLFLDPPEHSRYRRMLARPFSRDGVEVLRPAIERVVADALDAIERAGPPVDLVQMYASPIALASHCIALGVPTSDGERFRRLGEDLFDPSTTLDDLKAAFGEFCDYLRPAIEEKRAQRGHDVLSEVTSLDDALSEEEIFSIAAMLFLAGRTTMMNMLAGGLFALLANRAQLDVLVGDPDAVDVAVDELLRYVSVLAFGVTRRAVADVELGGAVISAGDHVTAALHGANRDAAKWDAPDVLDLTRRATGHAAFGHGVHICLGQHLARLEMRIALPELLRRFPSLHLAVPATDVPLYSGDQPDFGLHALPAAGGLETSQLFSV